MNQISLAQTGFELSTKRTRKREFLDEMNAVIPWAALLGLLRRHAPESRMGRLPFALETILRFRHFLEAHQLGAALLATVNAELSRKGLLLRQGSVVDATLIAAPSSTKNQSGQRDPDMHQTQKGNQWHFGMKAHIGADADSGLVHTVTTTAANAHDVTQARELAKNTQQILVLFALSNLWMVRKRAAMHQA